MWLYIRYVHAFVLETDHCDIINNVSIFWRIKHAVSHKLISLDFFAATQ